MENQRLDRVIESMIQIPPIMHRKLHRELFKVVLQQFGMDIAPHHLMIMKELKESGTLHSSEIGGAISIAKPQMTHSIDDKELRECLQALRLARRHFLSH